MKTLEATNDHWVYPSHYQIKHGHLMFIQEKVILQKLTFIIAVATGCIYSAWIYMIASMSHVRVKPHVQGSLNGFVVGPISIIYGIQGKAAFFVNWNTKRVILEDASHVPAVDPKMITLSSRRIALSYTFRLSLSALSTAFDQDSIEFFSLPFLFFCISFP
ncbi:hypothetical protein BY458DRAFT_549911 [Sporodiniella umbellata]|nr:hypothetical protein BY458DRAFT_549911 [Sporodiniella umbellata]